MALSVQEAGRRLPADHKHANYDPSTGLFTSATYPPLYIPDDVTIDQFMFDVKPSYSGTGGATHYRRDPSGQVWLREPRSDRTYTFEQCRQRADALARGFVGHLNLGNDDVLAIYAPNDVDYGPACWAAFRAGGIITGANPSYTKDELAYQLNAVSKSYTIRGLLTHPDSLDVALKAAEKARYPTSRIILLSSVSKPQGIPDDILTLDEIVEKYRSQSLPPPVKLGKGGAKKKIAFLSFSSGTTGLPKAVVITHANVVANIIQVNIPFSARYKAGSRCLATLPYYHIYGLVVILHCMLYLNVANVIMPKFAFEPMLDVIAKEKIAHGFLVPPVVVLMAKHPAVESRLKSLRATLKTVMVGAAPMSTELAEAFLKRFPDVSLAQGYGLTETCTVIALPPNCEVIPGATAGVMASNISIKILSLENKPVGPGELGEIVSHSPSNALSYLNNAQATKDTFDSEGFVHTGDEGYFDERGWLYVVDRRKELIKVKGNQVAPAELEGHILGHSDVADVCVIGVYDEYAGEAPRAFVVPSASAAAAIKNDPSAEKALAGSIEKWVADHKIKYKHLTGGVEFRETIPKNPSGKLLRRQLRDEYKARHQRAKL